MKLKKLLLIMLAAVIAIPVGMAQAQRGRGQRGGGGSGARSGGRESSSMRSRSSGPTRNSQGISRSQGSRSWNRGSSSGDRGDRTWNRSGSTGDRGNRTWNRSGSTGDRGNRTWNRSGSTGDRGNRTWNRSGSTGDRSIRTVERRSGGERSSSSIRTVTRSRDSDRSSRTFRGGTTTFSRPSRRAENVVRDRRSSGWGDRRSSGLGGHHVSPIRRDFRRSDFDGHRGSDKFYYYKHGRRYPREGYIYKPLHSPYRWHDRHDKHFRFHDHHRNKFFYYPRLHFRHHHRPIIRIYGYIPFYTYPHVYYYDPVVRIYEPSTTVIVRDYADEPVTIVDEPTRVYESAQDRLTDEVLRDTEEKRVQAARELAAYDNLNSVAVLVDVLINDSSADVRIAAAESLGTLGDPLAYEALVRSASAEQETAVQDAARQAAELIKAKVGEDAVYVSPTMPPMNTGEEKLGEHLEELRFGDKDVREEAAEKLEDLKGTQATAALINVLINDPEKDVREEAAESLGKIGDRMALGFLQAVSENDPEKSVRKEAEKATEKIYKTFQ